MAEKTTSVDEWLVDELPRLYRERPALLQSWIERLLSENEELRWSLVVQAYQEQRINLGKAAELLDMSEIELRDQFVELGIPLRLGPANVEEAQAEIKSVRAATPRPVLELRVALTAREYESLVRFYCDGLGLESTQTWPAEQGRAVVLDLGRATLEVFDEQQATTIDQLEAGQRVSGRVRLALQVPDLEAAMERLLAHGATLVHPPVRTPWGDYNVRLQDPEGMQVTLFQARELPSPI